MVLYHAIFISLHLWRTFKGSSRVKSWRTFNGSLRVKRWKTFKGSSQRKEEPFMVLFFQLSIVWRSLTLVQIAKGSRWNLWLFWRTLKNFFSQSVYIIFYKTCFLLCFVSVSQVHFLSDMLRNLNISKTKSYVSSNITYEIYYDVR